MNLATIVSLLLCVATAVPWMLSRAGRTLRFSWGQGLNMGYGYVRPNTLYYEEGMLFYLRARPPLVSLASLGAGPAITTDLHAFGLHIRRGRWSDLLGRDATLHRCHVYFPDWWPPAAAGILPAAWLVAWVRQRRRRPRPGHCASCGYDLRATPGRCPECGAVAEKPTAA